MITLFHSPGARSLRCIWLLEELGLEYELKTMEFPARLSCPEFLDVNPLGSVPYLIDGDTRMNESCAILQYLDGRYGGGKFSMSSSEKEYAQFLNWLFFGECSLTMLQAVALRYRFFLPKEKCIPEVSADYQHMVKERLALLSEALSTSSGEFLCGDRFTLADVSVGYALILMKHFKLSADFCDQTNAYLERLCLRPAFLAAVAKH
jgi:glutathione S-transferase